MLHVLDNGPERPAGTPSAVQIYLRALDESMSQSFDFQHDLHRLYFFLLRQGLTARNISYIVDSKVP